VIDLIAEDLSFDELVDRARGLAVPGRRHILGLTGAPGAGKSTVAGQLVDALGPAVAELVPMDGFHLADEVLRAMGRRERKGAHDTFDAAGYASLMSRIRDQTKRAEADDGEADDDGIVYAPRFLREIEEPIGSSIPIHPATPLIITEGNYLLLEHGAWPRARAVIDQVWFLAPPESVRQNRLIRRHESYGKTRAEAELWALGSDQRNAEAIAATASRADAILRLT
jgi:pantothenate kinase